MENEITENDFNLMVVVSCSVLLDHYLEKSENSDPEVLAVSDALSSIRASLTQERMDEVVEMLNKAESYVKAVDQPTDL